VSPSTPRILLLAGLLVLLSACGEPPQALPTAPPYVPGSAASVAPALTTPPPATPTLPPPPLTYPTYPVVTTTITTVPPTTTSPTPTPSHAPACVGEPTGAQILTLVKAQKKGVPTEPLKVDQGPFCAGEWSFTTVEIVGKDEDQLEPLLVLATGKGATLTFVAAGSDVCSNRVQTTAPAGIRVLACGF
jgi:hypothetical protein